jgi:hypothetical protein
MNFARLAAPISLALALPLIGCGKDSSHESASPVPSHEATPEHAQAPAVQGRAAAPASGPALAVGEHLMVAWKDKVYPTTVIGVVDHDHAKVHYENFGNEWDEVVGRDRIRGVAGGGAAAPAAPPRPAAPEAPEAVDDFGRAEDGLPAVIPPPGSSPPSVAEWNAVPKEITVRGSSAHGCETKMLREWLRVSCHQHSAGVLPSEVRTVRSGGQQAFVGKFGDATSAVIQVVHGREYEAEFEWQEAGETISANLFVHWPSDQPRPSLYFDR